MSNKEKAKPLTMAKPTQRYVKNVSAVVISRDREHYME